MILKTLFRRKGRTILTTVAIAIGVAAIIALGGVAQGIKASFASMARGSDADLVLTQANAFAVFLSSIDEGVVDELRTWPEVADVDSMLFANALINGSDYLFLFGHDPEGFSITHFQIVEGQGLDEVRSTRGRPILLGWQAAQNLGKQVGDTIHITGSAFRIVGIYETGDGFEDSGAVLALEEAQVLALQQRHVSSIYILLRDPAEADRFEARVERQFPDLAFSTSTGFADQEQMVALIEGMTMGIAGLAVVIGGLGMMNTLFMSVFERTREIGLLRAVGWRRRRVLGLILGESLALSLLGGLAGAVLGVLFIALMSSTGSILSVFGTKVTPDLFVRALVTVTVLGLVGGAYPSWWASRLLPLEALHYEGGSGKRARWRLPGGMAVRNLWRQRTRTILTLLGIGVSVSAIVAFGALAKGMMYVMTQMWRSSDADLSAIQAGVDSDFSAIDERVGARIAARSDVEAVSGMFMTGLNTEQMPMLLVYGYHPREFAIRHFRIVEGEPLTARHQVIVGRQAAEQMGVEVGDTLRLMESSFRVVGIFETGLAFEEIGVVISLREIQNLMGKPHQVMYYAIKLRNPGDAEDVRDELEAQFPEVDFALAADVAQSMSDFQVLEGMVSQISFVAIFLGGLGMLNTMLMSVLERTREIGVLRALGWRRRNVLGMILRESLVLGVIGGVVGILLGFVLNRLLMLVPGTFGAIELLYTPALFVQAMVVSIIGGVVGGLYPAWRATRMRPVEALRYE